MSPRKGVGPLPMLLGVIRIPRTRCIGLTGALACIALAALVLIQPVAAAEREPAAGGEAAAAAPDEAPAPAEPTPAAPGGTAAEQKVGQVTIRQIIAWGGPIGYFIMFLSVITLTLIIIRASAIRRAVLVPDRVRKRVDELFKQKKLREALEFCQQDGSVLARVITAGLGEIRSGYPEMDRMMNDVGEEEATRLHQGVSHFSLLASIAPLCGLLGTVLGMILTFNKIANAPEGVTSPATMANSIQVALVTTFFGLLVAIPNVCAFTFFRNRLVRLMIDVGIAADELMGRFKGLRASPRPAPKPAAPKAPAPEEAKPEEEEPEPEEEEPEEVEGEQAPEERAEGEQAPAEEPEAEEATAEEGEAAVADDASQETTPADTDEHASSEDESEDAEGGHKED